MPSLYQRLSAIANLVGQEGCSIDFHNDKLSLTATFTGPELMAMAIAVKKSDEMRSVKAQPSSLPPETVCAPTLDGRNS